MAKRNFSLTDDDIEIIATMPADRSAVVGQAINEAHKEPLKLVETLKRRLEREPRADAPKKRTVTVSIGEKTLRNLCELNSRLGFGTEQTLGLALHSYFMSHGAWAP